MKLTTIIVLALGTLVAAEASNVVNRGLDCKKAEQSYDFCVKNGHTPGQTGCKYTCRDRVCDQQPGAREKCGGVFVDCPEKRRWL